MTNFVPDKKPLDAVLNPELLKNIEGYTPSDLIYNPDKKLTPAAVMILIHRRSQEVLFIVRSEHVGKHRGQIGLPGGKVESSETPLEAGLRESREEIGLRPDSIEVIGPIDRLQTITDFLVHPFVALWEQEEPLVLDKREINATFSVPLEFLLNPANIRREYWERNLEGRDVFFWQFHEHMIWGVTGDILESLYRVIKGESLKDILDLSPSRMDTIRKKFTDPD